MADPSSMIVAGLPGLLNGVACQMPALIQIKRSGWISLSVCLSATARLSGLG
jgi:hypothetical protein